MLVLDEFKGIEIPDDWWVDPKKIDRGPDTAYVTMRFRVWSNNWRRFHGLPMIRRKRIIDRPRSTGL